MKIDGNRENHICVEGRKLGLKHNESMNGTIWAINWIYYKRSVFFFLSGSTRTCRAYEIVHSACGIQVEAN